MAARKFGEIVRESLSQLAARMEENKIKKAQKLAIDLMRAHESVRAALVDKSDASLHTCAMRLSDLSKENRAFIDDAIKQAVRLQSERFKHYADEAKRAIE